MLQQGLGAAQRGWRLDGQRIGPGRGVRLAGPWRTHFVDNAVPLRRCRAEHLAQEQEFRCAYMAQHPRQNQAGGGLRHQAQVDERQREPRIGIGDYQITVEQHGGADADCHATDACNKRLGEVGDALNELERWRVHAGGRCAGEIAEIIPTGERTSGTGELDDPNGRVGGGIIKRGGHRTVHRQRQRVLGFRSRHAESQHGAASFGQDVFAHARRIVYWSDWRYLRCRAVPRCFHIAHMHALALRAGPDALRILRERGLQACDVDLIPAASGGAKWLAIGGLDRFLFGQFLREPRTRPMHLIGSSIGSWRMACLAQRDPLAALARGHHAYIHDQRYSAAPTSAEITRVLAGVLDTLLGPSGIDETLSHPWARLSIITAQARGLANGTTRSLIGTALTTAALLNVVARRTLALQFRRVVFSSDLRDSPLRTLRDLPTTHIALTAGNLRDALRASGSIPLVVDGVNIPSAPGGMHWDGGVTDYHLNLDFGAGDGLILYPHFYSYVVPGWFDKSLRWRHASGANFRRALLLAPSDAFVRTFPGARIPDRRDFFSLTPADRIRVWERVNRASDALGDELGDLLASGRLAERVVAWS
jgi:hypothetical protein